MTNLSTELPTPADPINTHDTRDTPTRAPVDTGFASRERSPSPLLKIHVNARGFALTTLAVLATVFALQWAEKFLIPLVFGILITYTLSPLMSWMHRHRVPRVVGATMLMIFLVVGAVSVGNSLRGEFSSIMERLPAATYKLSGALKKDRRGPPSTIQQMQKVATEIEKATNQATGVQPSQQKIPQVAAPVFSFKDWLLAGSMNVIGFAGETVMVIFLVYFLLLSGDTFKRKLVKLTGPSLSKKRITLQILEDINRSIQRYMFMLLVTNCLLAVLMWILLRLVGLENAGAWAVAAGFLHLIPYFGPLFIAVATGISSFMQFESFSAMLLVSASSLAIATVVGTLVTTWMTGRIAKMNAAAVFIGLLFRWRSYWESSEQVLHWQPIVCVS